MVHQASVATNQIRAVTRFLGMIICPSLCAASLSAGAFTLELHYKMTTLSLACETSPTVCGRLEADGVAIADILDGVQSNDHPAFFINANAPADCLGRVVRNNSERDLACFRAVLREPRREWMWRPGDRSIIYSPLPTRSHFGDLQFLHAMAAQGQPAALTVDNIKMWVRFAYLTSLGVFDPRRDVGALPVDGLKVFFPPGSRLVKDLMDYRADQRARGIAIGQILHIVQDSFVRCHTHRDEDGRVVQFYSAHGQDRDLHGRADADEEFLNPRSNAAITPVEFGRKLVELRAIRADVSLVDALIDRFFVLKDGTKVSSRPQLCASAGHAH